MEHNIKEATSRRTLSHIGWLAILHIGPPMTCACAICNRTRSDEQTGGVYLTNYHPLKDAPLCVDCMLTLLRDTKEHIKERTGKEIDV